MMSDPKRENGKERSLRDTRMAMSADLQALLPETMLDHYELANEMRFGDAEGGSKFDYKGNIFDILTKYPDLADKVAERVDDREALLEAGAPESAFLPAIKGPEAPGDLPEALYYKVENVEGRLGIIQIKELPRDTRVLVSREKGSNNPDDLEYASASLTVIRGTADELPKTDYATLIIGREQEKGGEDILWTTHPGPPIRPTLKDFEWSRDLVSPEGLKEGEKRKVIIVTIEDLIDRDGMSPEDYVKIVPGDLDEVLEKFDVV
jgi:hypothetical protein